MLQIFSNRTNSKQEKIRIPYRPSRVGILIHKQATLGKHFEHECINKTNTHEIMGKYKVDD